jgi:hypothetical protein
MQHTLTDAAPVELAKRCSPGDIVELPYREIGWLVDQVIEALENRCLVGRRVGNRLHIFGKDQAYLADSLACVVEDGPKEIAHDIVEDLDLGRAGRRYRVALEGKVPGSDRRRLGSREEAILATLRELAQPQRRQPYQPPGCDWETQAPYCAIYIPHGELALRLDKGTPSGKACLSRALRRLERIGYVTLARTGRYVKGVTLTTKGAQKSAFCRANREWMG